MRGLQRVVVVIIGIIFLLFPLVLLLLRNPKIKTLLTVGKTKISNKYSVESDLSEYTVSMMDTSYLDYMAAKFNLFSPNAVIGSDFYIKKLVDTKRQQINHIKFVLVDHVDAPISMVQLYSGKTATVDCQGDYVLNGSTLVDRVSVNFTSLGKQVLLDKFAWENSFLRCALTTLYYAKGVTNLSESYHELVDIKKDIDNNIYSGIFTWPFRITSSSI